MKKISADKLETATDLAAELIQIIEMKKEFDWFNISDYVGYLERVIEGEELYQSELDKIHNAWFLLYANDRDLKGSPNWQMLNAEIIVDKIR